MFPHIKNGTVRLMDDTMHYIRFGTGSKNLIFLPGLGDGLFTVKGTALPMAFMYRAFSKEYTVYMFSRRNKLPENASTRGMARDLKAAMDALGIERADIVGVSMGGMIAQHFAVDHPRSTNRLVLAVTCAEPNAILSESVREWIALAEKGDHAAFMDSQYRRIYSDAYYRKNRLMAALSARLTRPGSYDRFLIQARACLDHNAADRLPFISARTLVIGGEKDRALGPEPSRRIASAIEGAQLKMYPDQGHSPYDEIQKDFQQTILTFLRAEA